ncbi:MAG: radical SAM family heme chaperone HemW, partial [Chloroflexi bacterium]|nr:radical SAM family heme chaperone HemW [Chloroflexota bacterium]
MADSVVPNATTAGLYVHVPWCRSICNYCDFDRQEHAFELVPAYVEALCLDITRQPAAGLHSIFFGGGTPSLLTPEQVGHVLDAARRHFSLEPDAEITLEANPGDLTVASVRGFSAAGVNRLSLGVQSFDDLQLRLLSRRHNSQQAIEAYRAIRAGGIDNISLDLMYGLPGQSVAGWELSVDRALDLGPDHLSCYLLTVDERVPLGRRIARGGLAQPPDDDIAAMYFLARERLAVAGLEHYEISNWARPGRRSRHNLTYWRDEPYLALGSGAAGSWQGRRYKHTPDPALYIRGVQEGQAILVEDDSADPATALLDHLALGLRLGEGLDLDRLEARFGHSARSRV